VSAVDQAAIVQQLEIATYRDLGARILMGEVPHQCTTILVDEVDDGAAAFFIED
jgi:hypothetical protein